MIEGVGERLGPGECKELRKENLCEGAEWNMD